MICVPSTQVGKVADEHDQLWRTLGAGVDGELASVEFGGDVVEFVEDPPCSLDDAGAVLGEAALGTVDERDAEFLLEAGDVARDVGLDGEQGARCGGERAVIGDRDQGGQLAARRSFNACVAKAE